MDIAPILLAGQWIDGPAPLEAKAPADDILAAWTSAGGLREIEAATAGGGRYTIQAMTELTLLVIAPEATD